MCRADCTAFLSSFFLALLEICFSVGALVPPTGNPECDPYHKLKMLLFCARSGATPLDHRARRHDGLHGGAYRSFFHGDLLYTIVISNANAAPRGSLHVPQHSPFLFAEGRSTCVLYLLTPPILAHRARFHPLDPALLLAFVFRVCLVIKGPQVVGSQGGSAGDSGVGDGGGASGAGGSPNSHGGMVSHGTRVR